MIAAGGRWWYDRAGRHSSTMAIIRDYRDLVVWQRAMQLAEASHGLATIPPHRNCGAWRSTSPRGDVDSRQHRGGTRAKTPRGIPSLLRGRARITHGSSDPPRTRPQARLCRPHAHSGSTLVMRRDQPNAYSTAPSPRRLMIPLTPTPFPLPCGASYLVDSSLAPALALPSLLTPRNRR